MEDLPFYSRLNPLQKSYADKIAAEARAMGISPKLAVAIAYQESRLNPQVGKGSAGEIGVMQVRPETAKMLGIDAERLKDPNTNIITGLRYLKQALDAAEGDPRLAALGYNAGIGAIKNPDSIPESTLSYLKDLKGYGTFGAAKPVEAPPEQTAAPVAAAAPAPAAPRGRGVP